MNSVEINEIYEELDKYSNMSRDQLFNHCVKTKLSNSLVKYQREIEGQIYYLLSDVYKPWTPKEFMREVFKIHKKDLKNALASQEGESL